MVETSDDFVLRSSVSSDKLSAIKAAHEKPRNVVVKKVKAKPETPTLFPGFGLNAPVRTTQHGACLVGATAELVCEAAFGGRLQGSARDSDADLFPDLYYTKTDWMTEVKACKNGGRFLIGLNQMERYSVHGACLYALVCYQHTHPVQKGGTVGSVIEAVAQTISDVFVFDVRIMHAMSKCGCIEGVVFRRNCKLYFPGRPVLIRDYMTIRPRTLLALRDDHLPLLKALNLPAEDWTFSSTRRRVRFKYDDIEFKSHLFSVHELRESVPF